MSRLLHNALFLFLRSPAFCERGDVDFIWPVMQDLESAEPQKVFTANPGCMWSLFVYTQLSVPWPLLFKILVGVLLFVNLCTLAIFALETPELMPEPNKEVLQTLKPYPKAQPQLPDSYTTNIIEGHLYSAVCGLSKLIRNPLFTLQWIILLFMTTNWKHALMMDFGKTSPSSSKYPTLLIWHSDKPLYILSSLA